jgi:hypothetical protein
LEDALNLQKMSLTVLAIILVMFAGCSKSDKATQPSGNNTVTLHFVGTVNGDNGSISGSITFSVNDSVVTGTFRIVTPDTATHALTGIYNSGTKALSATDGSHIFGGVYDGVNRLAGVMTGAVSGTFVAVKDDNNSALAFCGTFSGDDSGIWNFTIDGTIIAGSYTTTAGVVGALDGTISNNSISITNPAGGAPLAIGTRNGDNASGTWNGSQGSSGAWTGHRSN